MHCTSLKHMEKGTKSQSNAIKEQSKSKKPVEAPYYYDDVVRTKPEGTIINGYKDVLFITAAQEAFEEHYIDYVKKGNKDNGKKSARTKADFHKYLTISVNKTKTTTPLSSVKDCLAAKNYTTNVEKHVAKIIKDESGIRDTKTLAEIAYAKKRTSLCIDESHTVAWEEFYESMIAIMGDDPGKTSKFKASSAIDSKESEAVEEPPTKKFKLTLPTSTTHCDEVDPFLLEVRSISTMMASSEQRAQEKHELEMKLLNLQYMDQLNKKENK